MYKVSASIHDIEVRTAPLTPACELDLQAIKAQVDSQSKLLFICSPNNPTANLLDSKAIEELIEHFPGIVVVDEAYIDFSPQKSWIERIPEFENLIVLQTLSKAYGMAGIRLGMAFASEELTKWLMRVKAPYNLSKNTQELALQALSEQLKIKSRIQDILNERSKMMAALEHIPAVEKIWPTDANFVLIRIKNALKIYKNLADQGIIVRYRGNEIHCENSLRISIGTPDENQAFLEAFKALVS
jgi:histidinol-phosphate aminotransferase